MPRRLFSVLPTFAVAVGLTVYATIVPTAAAPPEPDAAADTDMKAYQQKIDQTEEAIEFVPIPGGTFTMGSPDSEKERRADEGPQHTIDLAPFWMSKCEITWDQYDVWGESIDIARRQIFGKQPTELDKVADAVTRPTPPYTDMSFGMGKQKNPAICMTQHAARKYCEWLSAKTGHYYRLPTEAEWEKAARGTDARRYPWGNEWQADYCNTGTKTTTPVTMYPEGKSPFDCFDMVGNVSEWTNTVWGHDPAESDFPYPYRADDGREASQTEEHVNRIFRGGSFRDRKALLTCSARRWYSPNRRDKRRGFRIVLEVEK